MIEEWRPVVGYEGLYKVSNLGRIKNLERITSNNIRIREHVQKQQISKSGYLAAAAVGTSARNIANCYKGRAKTVRGYIWKYKE